MFHWAVFLILSCMSCLFILEINPLSVVWFVTVFSHSEGCLLTLFISSFAVQKLFSLSRSHLFIYFCFYFHYSRSRVKEDLAVIYVKECTAYKPSSTRFIVSGITFKSLIHFEFIFVYGVRKYSCFILLHVAVQFSQHHWLKRQSFLHYIFLPPLSKIRCPKAQGFISELSVFSIGLYFCFYASTILSWWL